MKRLLIAVVFLAVWSPARAQVPDCTVVAGWQQQGPSREYGPDTLFDYMNGNAEGYLIYQFVNLKGLSCQRGTETILVDVYEMANPEFAYGIFCANRDQKQPIESIGMGGQVGTRRALFAKDKYYLEVIANQAQDQGAVLRAFAVEHEKRIAGRATPPEVLAWFPKERLVPNSVRLVPQSVLGLSILKRGYVGQYDMGKAFLVEEETAAAASQIMAKLRQRFGQTTPARIADEAFTATDKYLDGICIFRQGRHIGGYANLKEGRDASAEASALAAAIK